MSIKTYYNHIDEGGQIINVTTAIFAQAVANMFY